jgi:surface antigen
MTPDSVLRPRAAWGLALAMIVVVSCFATWSPAGAAAARRAVTAADLGYPYPNAPDCVETTGKHCVKDQWDFVQGQCHSWVAYRLNELNADELDGATFDDHYLMTGTNEWNNPSNWDNAAASVGITMDSTPALGSVAWWSEDGAHVAYVESVNRDGSILISEMNTDWHNGFDFATLRPGGRWPDAFIHIADRPAGTGIPLPPTTVLATATAARHAKVSWKAPARNGTTITGYLVTASPGGATVAVGAAVRNAVFRHLTTGTSYTFTVHATSARGDGFESTASNAVVPAAGVGQA